MKHTFPLLKQQIKILPYELKSESKSSQNTGFAFEIKGNIKKEKIISAINKLCKEHDAIRTHLDVSMNGELVQISSDDGNACIIHDMQGYSKGKGLEQSLAEIKRMNRIPMDIFVDPMIAFHMYILGENDILIYVRSNHILIDGPSLRVIYATILNSIVETSANDKANDITPLSWEDFVKRELEYESSDKGLAEKKYWESYQKNMPSAINDEDVRCAIAKSGDKLYKDINIGKTKSSNIDGKISNLPMDKLNTAAKNNKTSVFNVTLFLYTYALGQIFDRDEISVNYTVSNRFNESARYTIGLTTHTVPHTVKGLKWKSGSDVFVESKAEFERNLGKHIIADNYCNSPFTMSYLSETVKIPEPEGYEFITHTIPGTCNQNDINLILMCNEKKESLELSIVADKNIYNDVFFDRLYLRMADILNSLVMTPEEYREISSQEGVISIDNDIKSVIIDVKSNDGYIPLTYTQKDYIDLTYRRAEPALNLGNGVVLKGKYDLDRLERAVRKLYERYDALRMVFHIKKTSRDAYLTIDNSISRGIEIIKAKGDDRDSRYAFSIKDAHERMNVSSLHYKDSMARFWAYVIDEDEIAVCFMLNHMISDGTSVNVLQMALLMLYQNPDRTDLPNPGRFEEFLKRRDALYNSKAGKASAQYWAHRLDGYRSPEIPKIGNDVEEGKPTFRPLIFSAEKIRKISRNSKTSSFNISYMLWKLALAELCAQPDIVLRYAYAGRNTTSDLQMIGMLVHGITGRTKFSAKMNWLELMDEHKMRVNEDMKHVDTADIVRLDDFSMSYLLMDSTVSTPSFEGFEVSETFTLSLSKTYDSGNYLIAMGIEMKEQIMLVPFGSSLIYSKGVLERLEHLVSSYVDKLYKYTDMTLDKLCENPDFLKIEESINQNLNIEESKQVPEQEEMQVDYDKSNIYHNESFDIDNSKLDKENDNESDKRLYEVLFGLVKEYLDLDDMPSGKDDFFELGGNSFKAFCVINNLTDEYKDGLIMSDFYEAECLDELANILSSRVNG